MLAPPLSYDTRVPTWQKSNLLMGDQQLLQELIARTQSAASDFSPLGAQNPKLTKGCLGGWLLEPPTPRQKPPWLPRLPWLVSRRPEAVSHADWSLAKTIPGNSPRGVGIHSCKRGGSRGSQQVDTNHPGHKKSTNPEMLDPRSIVGG